MSLYLALERAIVIMAKECLSQTDDIAMAFAIAIVKAIAVAVRLHLYAWIRRLEQYLEDQLCTMLIAFLRAPSSAGLEHAR